MYIVCACRSKDIENSGFNGTAAFMEVRVQSIVVEFILNHVSQLFSGEGMCPDPRQIDGILPAIFQAWAMKITGLVSDFVSHKMCSNIY